MSHSTISKLKAERLSIRATPQQKRALKQAAKLRHLTLSQFVLQVSLRQAEGVLLEGVGEEKPITVAAQEYEWLYSLREEASPEEDLRSRATFACPLGPKAGVGVLTAKAE